MASEVIPAILAKTREELLARIRKVKPFVRTVHIDVMDGIFVPNKTISAEELVSLPGDVKYEFHWMVKNPEEWIVKAPVNALHLVHVETITDWEKVKAAAGEVRGTLGIVFNPDTPIEKVLPYAGKVKRFLVMAVHPGFSGQKYLPAVEEKIKALRRAVPDAEIEIDGGVSAETAPSAVRAGVDILAAASAIFGATDIKSAIARLMDA